MNTLGIPRDRLGIPSEYAPFLLNTHLFALRNLKLVGEYDASRSPYIILIKAMHDARVMGQAIHAMVDAAGDF